MKKIIFGTFLGAAIDAFVTVAMPVSAEGGLIIGAINLTIAAIIYSSGKKLL